MIIVAVASSIEIDIPELQILLLYVPKHKLLVKCLKIYDNLIDGILVRGRVGKTMVEYIITISQFVEYV